ncbi:helix-turn-helix domain-containing protein [Roseateles asaccharophilus]|uniref:Helix-turn-helix domain-containing protein n=1 Tax=Roseateles asaccharophilus TaxID=582607 RepID=A0ABU2A474_9BURK|nr:helix-turn-helix domain-containing protein [Roseateles asaccharophilus]MDR7331994.1 hypothetical protein [Roseateles asaccharophilus]
MSVTVMAQVWRGSRHAGTELLMLLALADFSDDDGNSYPAVSTLARKCRMQPRNANYILKALQASGELQVRPNEGPHGTNRYRIVLKALQSGAGVQSLAGVQPIAPTPAMECAKPLQRTADKPSMNHQEPSKAARKRAATFDASAIQLPEWLPRSVWAEWVADRRERRKPISSRAAGQQLKRLAEYRDQGHDVARVIEHSIANGYQGLFPPKEDARKVGRVSPALAADDLFTGNQT